MADADEISSSIIIDPSTFDLVVAGTGLPASLIAAASAANKKSVLHIDPHPFYGAHSSSVSPTELTTLFPSAEIQGTVPNPSGRFLLDVSGPRVMYCADPMIDVMLRSGASRHVDFKSLDGNLIYLDGELCNVPDSREGIFKDKKLGLTEKSMMMRFLKLVKGYVESGGVGVVVDRNGITKEDLELPFVNFLEKQRLPKKIRSIILYAIAMAVYDQDGIDGDDDCEGLIKTKDGLQRLALYSYSLGRFPNATGAFIYPIYGQGELPQAFCRCAAVKGAIYVLRMSLTDLLISKEGREFEGVRLGSGQDISCEQLVVDSSITIPLSIFSDQSDGSSKSKDTNLKKTGSISKVTGKVARMICITRHSINPGLSNLLVFFPPKSLHNEQMATIWVLQLGHSLAFCPSDLFIIYLSTPCENDIQGKEYLHAAVDTLFSHFEKPPVVESVQEDEPIILWSAAYVHELTQVSSDKFTSCPMPDICFDYQNMLEKTKESFQKMYPGEEFFPESAANEDNEEED